MFCHQCGAKIPEEAKFCPNCGANLQGGRSQATATAVANQIRPIVSKKQVGKLYMGLSNLTTEILDRFKDNMTPDYQNMDTFVLNIENDIEDMLTQVDNYFIDNFKSNGIYHYQLRQVSKETRQYVARWRGVFARILEQYQEITGEEAQQRAYREARKDGRGRVIGGGFGVSGAVKGMATAGMVNMTTGMFHSFANAIGNASTAAEADAKKKQLFYDPIVRKTLPLAIRFDCMAMVQGYATLWNQQNKGDFPVYSEEEYRQAENICRSILEGTVRQGDLDGAIEQMLTTYPVDDMFYLLAISVKQESKTHYYKLAAEYGIDLRNRDKKIREQAKKSAVQLTGTIVYQGLYQCLDGDLDETLETLIDLDEKLTSGSFMIFTDQNREKYKKKIQEARTSFAPYNDWETPIILMSSTVMNSGKKGIFMTDRYLYIDGGFGEERKRYSLEDVWSIKHVRRDDVHYIRINEETRAQTFDSGHPDTAVVIMEFLCAYCQFLRYESQFAEGTFLEHVLACAEISQQQLEAAAKAVLTEEEELPEPETCYCFECGAANDPEAVFCCECGAPMNH